ncbi:MAG: FGGY-family carbohydrate kinase [Chloroflexota bacterium]
MMLLAIDVGTTRCKVGLFDHQGRLLSLASRPTPSRRTPDGHAYDPEQLWQQLGAAIQDAGREQPLDGVTAVGVSSMAETGLLLAADGTERTPFIPWFDRRTLSTAEQLHRRVDVERRFYVTGARPSYKCAVSKLLWLQTREPQITRNATWLSVADYVVYRLSGALATDYSLATRTYAFDIDRKAWDTAWLREIGLPRHIFPEALPAGALVGQVTDAVATELDLPRGAPVVLGGHDHVCAAFAAGAVQPDTVFDSMGTAETLIGALTRRELRADDYNSGLTFGCHTARHRYYWMGGLSTSGGSLEWLRRVLGDPPLSYEALASLLETIPRQPSGIVYFPYLTGSGSPHRDEDVRAAFLGLDEEHGRADLLQAVLEGTAYEMEWIRRAAARATERSINHIVAAGGGARNRRWLQIKADVCGCPLSMLPTPEATLLGAALLAGLGSGVYNLEADALALPALHDNGRVEPDAGRHELYRRLYEDGYCRLQEPLRQLAGAVDHRPRTVPKPPAQDS